MSEGTSGVGCGFFLWSLQLLFIGLKLGKVIDWSWWWVMSPAMVWVGFLVLVLTLAGVAFGVAVREVNKAKDKMFRITNR